MKLKFIAYYNMDPDQFVATMTSIYREIHDHIMGIESNAAAISHVCTTLAYYNAIFLLLTIMICLSIWRFIEFQGFQYRHNAQLNARLRRLEQRG